MYQHMLNNDMATNKSPLGSKDIIEDIISAIDPEELPLDYVLMAKVVDFNGVERILKDKELEKIKNPEVYGINEARVTINATKLRRSIVDQLNMVHDEVLRLFLYRNEI